MLLHMHESNEAETDKRGVLVQTRRLRGRLNKKQKTATLQNGSKQNDVTVDASHCGKFGHHTNLVMGLVAAVCAVVPSNCFFADSA